jgi:hypothetical protein
MVTMPVGELQHLERLGELDQLADVVGDDLLGADGVIDGKVIVVKQLGMLGVVGRAQAGDARRDVEQRLGHPAGTQVGLVRLGDGDQQVGVLGAGGIAAPTARRRCPTPHADRAAPGGC